MKDFKLLFSVLKKVLFLLSAYVTLYFGFSVLWIVVLAIIMTMYEEVNSKKVKRSSSNVVNDKQFLRQNVENLPSWVMFPDVHRAEWMNKIIKQIWPSVNLFIEKKIRTTVEQKIKNRFERFKFDKVHFGYISPKINGVKVYNYKEVKNEIIVDLDLLYEGDADIMFSVLRVKGSIKKFQFSGQLRIVIKPLLPKLPLIGGLQIFFLNTPEFDFNVHGIAVIPGLKQLVKRQVLKLTNDLVFPNKIPIRLCKSLEKAELQAVEPEGVLRVHVVQAVNLEKKDVNILGRGKSDPYAIINVGAQQYKTKIIDNVVNPKWHFWCDFYILDSKVQHLDIEVLDYDIDTDDFLGSAVVDINEVIQGEKTDQWIPLEKVKHGKINIRFTWFDLSSDISHLKTSRGAEEIQYNLSTALVTVFVESATDIPLQKSNKKPNPHLKLTVGDCTQKTKSKKNCTDPEFNEGFSFLVASVKTDSLYLTMADSKNDVILDQCEYSIGDLLKAKDLEISGTELKFDNGCKVALSMELRVLKDSGISGEDLKEELLSREESVQRKSFGIGNGLKNRSVSSRNTLMHRSPSVTSSAGNHGLGRLQLTLRYSEPRHILVVLVHKLANVPLKDAKDTPDIYINMRLLPIGAGSKQKTRALLGLPHVDFDERFEYPIPQSHLDRQKLVLTVKSKSKRVLHNKKLGQVAVDFEGMALALSYTSWFDVRPV